MQKLYVSFREGRYHAQTLDASTGHAVPILSDIRPCDLYKIMEYANKNSLKIIDVNRVNLRGIDPMQEGLF